MVAHRQLQAAQPEQQFGAVRQLCQGGLRCRQGGLGIEGGQVVVNQRQPRRQIGRVGLDGLVQQGRNCLSAGTAAGHHLGQGQAGGAVARLGLEQGVEAGAGLLGLARLQVQAGQRQHGGQVARVALQRQLEGRAGTGTVLLPQQDLAAQLRCQRCIRLLARQRGYGLQRAVKGFAPQLGADQGQVGALAAVGRRHRAQLGNRRLGLAAGKLRQGHRRAQAGILGLEFAGALEQGRRRAVLAAQQTRLGGELQRVGVAAGLADQRVECGQGLGQLAQHQLGAAQQAAGSGRIGRQLQALDQQRLGLGRRLHLQRHRRR